MNKIEVVAECPLVDSSESNWELFRGFPGVDGSLYRPVPMAGVIVIMCASAFSGIWLLGGLVWHLPFWIIAAVRYIFG